MKRSSRGGLESNNEPATKFWRSDDFWSQRPRWSELSTSWPGNEREEDDERVAWTRAPSIARAAGGERDKAAETEVAEEALESFLPHRVAEDMSRDEAEGVMFLTSRLEKGWSMKDGEWTTKVRFLATESQWAEHREDVLSPGATHSAGRVIDFIAYKSGLGDVRVRRSGPVLSSTRA